MDIAALHREYLAGITSPAQVVAEVFERIEREGVNPVWISVLPREEVLARAAGLATLDRATLPLYGIPFAVKDNMDVAGMPTTAGCPAYAYAPDESATVVTKLEAAGAILIGKTNMDQFATGLVGTRSPYGIPASVFGAGNISGGSSSGSAVAVASGLVSFALGTDTAGSGRVPAMFNNLIGLKPTRGVISAYGVVPACRTLDCVSVFAETAADAALVLMAASGPDKNDVYSRNAGPGDGAAPWAAGGSFRFGVPEQAALEYFGDEINAGMYREAIAGLQKLGGEAVRFDLRPFLDAARLLYEGPWIAERYAAYGAFFEVHKAQMDPVVASIVRGAEQYSAAEAFAAAYRLEELRAKTLTTWAQVDVLALPTAGRTYTIAEIAEAPVERNRHLGYYTNFVNLLDLAAVAVPAGTRGDGLPFGISLIGQRFTEGALLRLADRVHRELNVVLGGSRRLLAETPRLMAEAKPNGCLLIAVVGAHLTGQPLNWQLTQRGGLLMRECKTSGEYKLFALSNLAPPPKPGLLRVPGFAGPGIEVEVWALPEDTVGGFVNLIPQPLGIGKLNLEDGSAVMGFICEPAGVAEAVEITGFGGWRAYLASKS